MFNKILTVVLLSSFVFLSHAQDKNVNCIKATRESRFPYGDEVARADFCVRLSDILTGFVNAEKFADVCTVKNDGAAAALLNAALNETQLLDIEQDTATGEWKVKSTSPVTLDSVYATWQSALNCDVSAQITGVADVMKTQFEESNLVVKKDLIDNPTTGAGKKAEDFAKGAFEATIIGHRIISELEKLKQKESSAQSSANAVNTGVAGLFDGFMSTLKESIGKMTADETGTGKITPEDIEAEFLKIEAGEKSVNQQLKTAETFSESLKESLSSEVKLTRQFELVKNHANGKVADERNEFFGSVQALMKDAWNNFEHLQEGTTFDTNA